MAIKSIKEQIEEEKKALAAVKLSDADATELADLATLAKARSEREDEEERKRDLDLARRLIVAKEIHGATNVRTVAIKGSPHTFIVKGNQAAHARWEMQIGEAQTNKKINKGEVARAYAIACIVDHNGKTGFDDDTVLGYELKKFLENNNGMVTPILNMAALLAGFLAEDAKS